MAEHRLGVVLLLPGHVSPEIDGLRRALGVSPIERVPPHVTLVLPIDVAADEIDEAIALTRRVAAEEQPLHIVLGPVDTFNPITPVVYLRVSGPGVDAIKRLRDGLDAGPLAQELAHPFVPHVTLSGDATDREIEGALASLTHYVEHLVLDTLTVLKEDDDKIWRPIADAPLAAQMTTRTVGADPVTISVTEYPTHAGATMGRYRSLAVEAFVGGHVVGLARGHVAQGDVAWLDELVVIRETRSTGVGGALARAFADAARAAQATEVRSVRGATVGGFLVRLGFVVDQADEFILRL